MADKNEDYTSPSSPEIASDFKEKVRQMAEEAEARKNVGKQLGLGEPDEDELSLDDALGEAALREIQDPDEAHELWQAAQRSILDNVPQGGMRDYVLDEKNLYLNRGNKRNAQGIRGSDGRAAYLHHLRVTLRVVKEWEQRGTNAWDLYTVFRKINEELGYHEVELFKDEEMDQKLSDMFSRAMHMHDAAEPEPTEADM